MNRPCPTCKQPASSDVSNPDRPFCSERCRMLDLGAWLTEDYAIPGQPDTSADDNDDDRSQY